VYPAFRADKIMNIEAAGYLGFLAKLEALTHPIHTISDLESALEKRLQAFIKVGCVASDIAVEKVYTIATKGDADRTLHAVLEGKPCTKEGAELFKGYLTYALMKMYAKYNIRTELHIGAMRNNNAKMLAKLGLDTGFDSISDKNIIPFAIDPFGNYICYDSKDSKVKYLDHETNLVKSIDLSLSEFIDSLY
jgi:glucuronate isomerase